MTRVLNTVQVEEDPGVFHIPGQHNMQQTLCGFVDVGYTDHDAAEKPCNCIGCADAWRAIKRLTFPDHYFDLPE